MADRSEYVAVNPIYHNGVRAYSPGDPVDARVVEPGGWVSLEDVKPSFVIPVPRPPANASQAAWAAYAVSEGADPELTADASRTELIKAYGKDPGGPPQD